MGPLSNESTESVISRRIQFTFLFALSVCLAGCGGVTGNLTSASNSSLPPGLTAADVSTLVQTAAQAADPNTMVIAVVDRAGNILGVYRKPSAPALATGNFDVQVDTNELAVSLARTA